MVIFPPVIHSKEIADYMASIEIAEIIKTLRTERARTRKNGEVG